MVTSINVVIQQCGGFGIGTGDNDQIGTHNIGRQSCRDQSINMFLRADQDFTTHVSTFFRARLLVFQMHTGCPGFNHEFGQFHHGR